MAAKKINIEEIVKFLPEVGMPIDRKCDAIHACLDEIKKLEARAEELRHELALTIGREWNRKEIVAARNAAKAGR